MNSEEGNFITDEEAFLHLQNARVRPSGDHGEYTQEDLTDVKTIIVQRKSVPKDNFSTLWEMRKYEREKFPELPT